MIQIFLNVIFKIYKTSYKDIHLEKRLMKLQHMKYKSATKNK